MADGEILQRFTPPAIRVVQYAKEEARRFRGNTVGSEHVLLGLIREQEGVAARVLQRFGVVLGRAQNEIRRRMDLRPGAPAQTSRSWSAAARRVLEYAVDEARELNPKLGLPNFVDTEHLLLALLRDPDSDALQVLLAQGVDPEQVRREILRLLGGHEGPPPLTRFPESRGPEAAPAERTPRVVLPSRFLDINTHFGYHPRTGVRTTPEEIRRAGEPWNVKGAFTYSLHAALYDYQEGNAQTLDVCRMHLGYFSPVAVLSPVSHRPFHAIEQVRAQGFAFVRIFPELHGFAVDGPACRQFLTTCGAAGLPAMIPVMEAGPANVLRALDGIRGTFLLTRIHYSVLGDVLALAGRIPNLFVDLSGVNTPDGIWLLAEAFGTQRLLFGSGYPALQIGCGALMLQRQVSAGQVEAVAHLNAGQFLRGRQ